jgi:hypothetical protein
MYRHYSFTDELEVLHQPPFIGTLLYFQDMGVVQTGALDQEALLFEVICDRQETPVDLWF